MGSKLLFILSLGVTLAATGCAHTKTTAGRGAAQDSAQDEASTRDTKSLTDVLKQDPTAVHTIPANTQEELVIRGVKLNTTQFDIPVVINSRVVFWVDYFTGKGRPHFERYLERSEFYIPYIQVILKQHGMPQDLVYLAMIESGFNNLARSHAKAVGPWQFMSATGKRYGLMVNWWVDERRDIKKSTVAAIEYLRDLYNMFQSWELAAASYNAGENKVAKAIQRYGTKDFWTISKQRYLRPETRDYVPKMIAAALIAKNRDQFGFKTSTVVPGADEAIAGDGEIVKVEKSDRVTEKDRQERDADAMANAVLEQEDADADSAEPTPATLTVPVESGAPEGTMVQADQPLARPVPTPHLSRDGREVSGMELAEFDVQSPADLLKVARAAGLSYHTVKSLNPELLRWCTPPSVRSYRVKLPASVKEKFLATYNHQAFPRQVNFLAYKAKNGDTLNRIARNFGIKVDPITDLNGISSKMPLRKGAKVLLPMPTDPSRSLSSLEVRDPPERRRAKKGRSGGRHYKVTYKKREAARVRRSLSDS